MLVDAVTKPVGTKDREFESYTRLLEDVGIEVSNSPRVPEPSTERQWLYAWKKVHQGPEASFFTPVCPPLMIFSSMGNGFTPIGRNSCPGRDAAHTTLATQQLRPRG